MPIFAAISMSGDGLGFVHLSCSKPLFAGIGNGYLRFTGRHHCLPVFCFSGCRKILEFEGGVKTISKRRQARPARLTPREAAQYETPVIRQRVAEMAAFFGIENWFYKNVTELSGGQKQLLNLASVMAMQPSVLILDEPTSQLDPIAASDFLATLGRINRELGTTILLTEHRLEDAFPLATRVAVMEEGKLLCSGTPAEVGTALRASGHTMFLAMPTAMRVWAAVEQEGICPVTVREGRDWLTAYSVEHPPCPLPPEPSRVYPDGAVLEASELWFKYEKDSPDVVRELNLTLKRGEFYALMGGNGAGKSTSLKLLAGLLKPYRGTVTHQGTIGVLPQNPQTLFVKKQFRKIWRRS